MSKVFYYDNYHNGYLHSKQKERKIFKHHKTVSAVFCLARGTRKCSVLQEISILGFQKA